MFQAVIDLNGTGGSLLLMAYVLGGFATVGVAFLPGATAVFRAVCAVLGLVMAFWALKVLLVGGEIFISAYVLIAPLVLIVRGVTSAVRRLSGRPAPAAQVLPTYLPAPTPHPATRQFTGLNEPGYHQPRPAYAAMPAAHQAPRHYVPQPQFVPQGYATVHHEYPAVPRPRTAPDHLAEPSRHAAAAVAVPRHGDAGPVGGSMRMPVVAVPAEGGVTPRSPRVSLAYPAPMTADTVRPRHRAAEA